MKYLQLKIHKLNCIHYFEYLESPLYYPAENLIILILIAMKSEVVHFVNDVRLLKCFSSLIHIYVQCQQLVPKAINHFDNL